MTYNRGSILMIGGLILALPHTATAQRSETRCVTENASIYERMAFLEADNLCPPVVLINRFRILLERIARRCLNKTPTRVADIVATARRLLYDGGIQAGYLEITEALDRRTSGETHLNCDMVLALYVTQRIGD